MKKSIKNINTIVCKLKPALIKVTNNRLEVAKKERQKKRDKKRRKRKAMTAKQCRAKKEISSSDKREDENNTGNKTNLDQIKHKYPLQIKKRMQ